MSFRRRMVVLSAGAVAAAVVIASVVVYVVTRNDLIGQVDRSLRQIPQSVQFQSQQGTRLFAGLKRQGKLPTGAAAQIGVTFGSAGQPVGGGAKLTAPAPVAQRAQGQVAIVERSDRSVTALDVGHAADRKLGIAARVVEAMGVDRRRVRNVGQ